MPWWRALTVAAVDWSITAVELVGDGPAFRAAATSMSSAPVESVSAHLARVGRSPSRLLAALAPRVTARVHGACVGAGAELAAFAGTVTALPGTHFQLPEVALGLIPGAGGTVSIPRRIGRHRAAWMGLTASVVAVETAHAWGLVDTIASDG